MNTNKKLVLTSLFTLGFSTIASADITDVIEKSYDFSEDGKIALSNINGDVTVTACNCDRLNLTATIEASDQETRDRITIEIDANDSDISIKTKYAKKDREWHDKNRHSKVDYKLSVPNNVALDNIDLVNGDLTVKSVTGELNADLVNGDLKSDGLTSDTNVSTVNGDIKLTFASLDNAEKVELNSVNGDIIATMPSNANASVKAETVSGKISNDFGIDVRKHKWVGSDMKGTIGDGSVDIKMNNVNGRIKLKSH
jgi:DUF4097 and DUF4098 domain-containing protein YvlB